MITPQTNQRAHIDRRTFVRRAGLALGGMVAAASLGGCAILGIEDPNAQKDEGLGGTPGLMDLDGLEVNLSVEPATWQWSVLDDTSSSLNGYMVVGVPAAVANSGDNARMMSSMYCKILGPDGATQADISGYYPDDMLRVGNLYVGASASDQFHILFRGSGTYTIQLDNMLGKKRSVTLDIAYNPRSGIGPFPSWLSWENVNYAVPQGESFNVGGLTLAFTTDPNTYVWTQVWAEGDEYWNGRGAVGIPVRVTNNTRENKSFADVVFQTYAPEAYKLNDCNWAFDDCISKTLTTLVPNQTAQGILYFTYEYGESVYYCCFSNEGMPVYAAVWMP